MRVVGDAQLVGAGQEEGVGFGNGLIRPELLDECIRLGRVAAAEDRLSPLVDESDLVLRVTLVSEVAAVAIVDQCEDAAADRDPRLARMAGFLPGSTEGPNLSGLLDVESFSGLVVLESRTLQIHAELC